MKKQSPTPEYNRQQILNLIEILKNIRTTNNLSFVLDELKSELDNFNAPLSKKFFNRYPTISNIADIYKIIHDDNNIWEILNDSDKILIKDILIFHNLKNEHEINKILNALAIHYLFVEFQKISNAHKVQKAKEVFELIQKYTKDKIKLKKSYSSFTRIFGIKDFSFADNLFQKIEKLPSEMFNLYSYLKRPNKKPYVQSYNFIIAVLIDIPKNAEIKDHLSKFTIPVLKELKAKFPEELKEITSLDKSYLLKRARDGRQHYPEKQRTEYDFSKK